MHFYRPGRESRYPGAEFGRETPLLSCVSFPCVAHQLAGARRKRAFLNHARVRKRSGPQVMAAFRNATIGLLRTMGVTNIAEALRRNASQVGQLFARLGIFKL